MAVRLYIAGVKNKPKRQPQVNEVAVCCVNPCLVCLLSLLFVLRGNAINVDWTDLGLIFDTLRLANKGDVVYIKAKTTNTTYHGGKQENFSRFITRFSPAIAVSDSASVAGNIMYLLNNEGKGKTVRTEGLMGYFEGNKIIHAKDLILPADTVFGNAYHSMFYGCTTLKSAPELPAKVFMGDTTYKNMFAFCSSLVAGPTVLPAEIVGKQAYQGMFAGC